jgi:hypothetical protein
LFVFKTKLSPDEGRVSTSWSKYKDCYASYLALVHVFSEWQITVKQLKAYFVTNEGRVSTSCFTTQKWFRSSEWQHTRKKKKHTLTCHSDEGRFSKSCSTISDWFASSLALGSSFSEWQNNCKIISTILVTLTKEESPQVAHNQRLLCQFASAQVLRFSECQNNCKTPPHHNSLAQIAAASSCCSDSENKRYSGKEILKKK